ncbi:MAG: four helix bundle protein [Bacteroidetes bacterium]|nr:MAG: four helix bundle protein [Bacteroidota bacterium]
MAKVDKFEDLHCWQEARILIREIYRISNSQELKTDYSLKDQIRRASVSGMNNIAEGFSRYNVKECVRFLNIAQSSMTEVKSMLYILEDIGYVEKERLIGLHDQVDKTKKLTLGFIRYLVGRKVTKT